MCIERNGKGWKIDLKLAVVMAANIIGTVVVVVGAHYQSVSDISNKVSEARAIMVDSVQAVRDEIKLDIRNEMDTLAKRVDSLSMCLVERKGDVNLMLQKLADCCEDYKDHQTREFQRGTP